MKGMMMEGESGAQKQALDELMQFARGNMAKQMKSRLSQEACPECGGEMKYEDGADAMKCEACGHAGANGPAEGEAPVEGAEAMEGEEAASQEVPGAESEEGEHAEGGPGKMSPEKLRAMLEHMRASKAG